MHEAKCKLHVSMLAILVSAVEFKICFRKIKTRERYVRWGCGGRLCSVNILRSKRPQFMVY